MPRTSLQNLPTLSIAANARLEVEQPLLARSREAGNVDQDRSRLLREAGEAAPSNAPLAELRNLADRLSVSGHDIPQTMASARCATEQGLRFAGALMDLAALYGPPVEFRIYPPGLEVPADELEGVEFDYVCDCLRRTFDRAAGAGADGYVAAVARAEYNVVNDAYRLYFRGLALGALGDALPCINDLDDYDFAPWQGSHSPPFLRVRWRQVKRRSVESFERLVPTDWRRIYEVFHERECVRQKLWSDMPLLRRAQLLLFWDTLKLRDITLLMRLRLDQHGLRLTSKGRGPYYRAFGGSERCDGAAWN